MLNNKKIWLVTQESNVDGELYFNVTPCKNEKVAKRVFKDEIKNILTENKHYNKCPKEDLEKEFDVEEDTDRYFIQDRTDDYYEELKVFEAKIVSSSYKPYNLLAKQTAVKSIRNFVGADGNVAFEHGFEYPTINLQGETYNVTMVNRHNVSVFKKYNDGQVVNLTLQLGKLTSENLQAIRQAMDNYVEFVKKTV